MAQVLVRDIESSVVEKIKQRARENGRSLEAEMRRILRDSVEDRLDDVERVRMLFADRQFDDSTALVREDRDR